jgi:hypothetical protein
MKKLVPYILFTIGLGAVAVIFYIDTLDMAKAAYQLPRLLIYLVMGLSILMIAEQVVLLRKPKPAAPQPNSSDNGTAAAPAAPAGERSLVRIAVFVTLLIAYIMTIKPLGYFIATPLFLIAILSYLRATGPLSTVLIAAGFTVFVYLLFVLFLNLPVPMGLLE